MQKESKQKIKDWLLISRLPFFSVAILPFLLGTFMASRLSGVFNLPVFFLALVAVILIKLSTHYSGEIYDSKEDALSAKMGRNAFSGGSQVLVEKRLREKDVKLAIYVMVVVVFAIGMTLQFYLKTGPWTLFLGITGFICGFFYSKPPFRWVKRGIGELLIAYSYGWLPVAVGFYLQTGKFIPLLLWISIPIACTIFNVIFINEFPDYPADLAVEKTNLLVRIGKKKGEVLYIAVALAASTMFLNSIFFGAPVKSIWFYLPVLALSSYNIFVVFSKGYESPRKLERACGLTIVVNLATTLAYILGFV